MIPPNDASPPDENLRRQLQTRHPGIADEIQGAIDTLRKLQDITGANAADQVSSVVRDPSFVATTDGTLLASSDDDDESHAEVAEDSEPIRARDVPMLAANDSFGRYQIVRQLGRGAMGAVYLAFDTQLQRYVALKTPVFGTNQIAIKRFYREARAAAQLRSQYLCPIYDVGQISGIHYLSMAFIDGQPLSRWIAEQRLKGPSAIAEIVKKIAKGLQKAHEQGIIHRDLKPDNIMMDADGEPIVMDFGLARRLDDKVQVTLAGRILGTPAYMSPEQAEGDSKKIGPCSDQYSLGVVLFEMLTGRVPFEGTLTSVLRQIGSDPPPKPSSLAPEIGEGSLVERVCLKMMAKSPEDRYPSVAAVAEALGEPAPGKPATSERPGLAKKLWAWATGLFGAKAVPKESSPPAAPVATPPQNSETAESAAADAAAPVPAPTLADPGSGEAASADFDHTFAESGSGEVPRADLGRTLADPGSGEAAIPVLEHTLADSSDEPIAAVVDRTIETSQSFGQIDLQGTSQTIDLSSEQGS
jgi:serine/threonine protein kinase